MQTNQQDKTIKHIYAIGERRIKWYGKINIEIYSNYKIMVFVIKVFC